MGTPWVQVTNAKNVEKHGTDGLSRLFVRIVVVSWKNYKKLKDGKTNKGKY